MFSITSNWAFAERVVERQTKPEIERANTMFSMHADRQQEAGNVSKNVSNIGRRL